jgi:hypothetical protein
MPREIQTAVQVANMALRVLQSRTIESLDDGDDPVAQTVKMYYANVLRRCISAYPWAFSLMEKQLQRLPESPIPRWKYAYHLPADFVDLVWLRADSTGTANLTDYESVAGDLILANEAQLWARYQYEPPVPTYPHHFLEFLVDSLIEELAGVSYFLRGFYPLKLSPIGVDVAPPIPRVCLLIPYQGSKREP